MSTERLRLGATLVLGAAAVASLIWADLGTSGASVTDIQYKAPRATVVATNRGPVRSCSTFPTCPPETIAWLFIYVENTNRLTNLNAGTTRATLPNAFAISSVDMTVFVDGAQVASGTFTPPPNAVPGGNGAGRWPSTVTCFGGCNVSGKPAILPGENTSAVYVGWIHGANDPNDPNGSHVFRFTVHGTLNNAPFDVSASSAPISMTD